MSSIVVPNDRGTFKKREKNSLFRIRVDRRVIHTILLTICSLLIFGDFLTTTMALSIVKADDAAQGMTVAEGNPFMAAIVNTPILFLFVKIVILLTVVASAYLLRKEGPIAYLPCILVSCFYIAVNLNNLYVMR